MSMEEAGTKILQSGSVYPFKSYFKSLFHKTAICLES